VISQRQAMPMSGVGYPNPKAWFHKIPVPREHGAWIMLLLPIVAGSFIGASRASLPISVDVWVRELLLIGVAVFAFAARNGISLFLRRRTNVTACRWGLVFALGTVLLAGPLLLGSGSGQVAIRYLALGVLPFVICHLVLVFINPRARLDRTLLGEIVGVAPLTATGPAAMAVASGSLGGHAMLLWLLCFGYFAGGVMYVKMLLEAARRREVWSEAVWFQTGACHLAYNVCLMSVLALVLTHPNRFAICLLIAQAPAIVRSVKGWIRLSTVLPPLKRLGMQEATYAVWFTGFIVLALRR